MRELYMLSSTSLWLPELIKLLGPKPERKDFFLQNTHVHTLGNTPPLLRIRLLIPLKI